MTHTIKSQSVIAYNNLLELSRQVRDVMFELPELKTNITYRRYNLNNETITGDLVRNSYTEYSIDAIVQLLLVDDRLVQMGEFKPGDCELSIKPFIDFDSNGTALSEPFEPQIDDEIWFKGYRFRIKLIKPEYMGNTKVTLTCLCSRMENTNPTTVWNENYYQSINDEKNRGFD